MQTMVQRSRIQSAGPQSERWPLVAVAGVALVLSVVLGVTSFTRVSAYRDILTLFQDAAASHADDAMVQINLGNALLEAGKADEAIEHYRRSIAIKPLQSHAYNNLGTAYLRTNRPQEAIEQYEQALRMRPNHPDARNNLGAALQMLGRWPEAAEQFAAATQAKADYIDAWSNLAAAQAHLERWNDSVASAEKALALARAQRNTPYAEQIERRLAGYRARAGAADASTGP